MIKLINLLKEIGDGTSKPYEYKKVGETNSGIYYTFKTDPNPEKTFLGRPAPGLDYEVDLRFWDLEKAKPSSTKLDVAFNTDSGEYTEETNDNVQYRIMATVVTIIKDALSNHPEIDTLSFTAAKSDSMDVRRARFYRAYIKKQIPNSTTVELKKGGFRILLK